MDGAHQVGVEGFVALAEHERPKETQTTLLTEDASLGISQASVVESDDKLRERVAFVHESLGISAIVEQYIEGRELYVGVMGNRRLKVFPVWELRMDGLPDEARPIATQRLKWSRQYQKKYGIQWGEARGLPDAVTRRVQDLAKRIYRTLGLSGYARIDFRLDAAQVTYALEANPNPEIAFGEELAESADKAGLSYKALLQQILSLGLTWRHESTRSAVARGRRDDVPGEPGEMVRYQPEFGGV